MLFRNVFLCSFLTHFVLMLIPLQCVSFTCTRDFHQFVLFILCLCFDFVSSFRVFQDKYQSYKYEKIQQGNMLVHVASELSKKLRIRSLMAHGYIEGFWLNKQILTKYVQMWAHRATVWELLWEIWEWRSWHGKHPWLVTCTLPTSVDTGTVSNSSKPSCLSHISCWSWAVTTMTPTNVFVPWKRTLMSWDWDLAWMVKPGASLGARHTGQPGRP